MQRWEINFLNDTKAAAIAGNATSEQLKAGARMLHKYGLWNLHSFGLFISQAHADQQKDFATGNAAALVAKVNAALEAAVEVTKGPTNVVAGAVSWIVGAVLFAVVFFVLLMIGLVALVARR